MKILSLLFLACTIGISCEVSAHRVRRLVGGEYAKLGQFPFLVSLRLADNGHHFCGGSIIRQNYILTAAHCLRGMSRHDFYIIAGISYLYMKANHYYAEKWVIHGHNNKYTSKNDIAIIKLKKGVEFSKLIQKISIYKSEPPIGVSMTICGWGNRQLFGYISSKLMYSNVTTIPRKKCDKRFDELYHRTKPVTKRHICTFDELGAGVCDGDSGGPLVYNGRQVGIVSWAVGCADGYPDVYVKLSSYAHWIEFTINKLKMM